MIKGERVFLRTVRRTDLPEMLTHLNDVGNRTRFTRLQLRSQPEFERQFEETGFFTDQRGTYLVTSPEGELLGDIVYFGVNYMNGYELGYQLYDPAMRGKGLMREALQLAVRNLFDTHEINRLQIATDPDNEPSKRLALSCGFQLEGRLRGHLFINGHNEDSLLYGLLRSDLPV